MKSNMIIIKDLTFIMEQVKSTPFFNLKLPVIVNEGKDNERTDMKIVGYGMPFETCIQQIISKRFAEDDTIYSVKEYIEEYISKVKELIDCVQYIQKESIEDTSEESIQEEEEEIENED